MGCALEQSAMQWYPEIGINQRALNKTFLDSLLRGGMHHPDDVESNCPTRDNITRINAILLYRGLVSPYDSGPTNVYIKGCSSAMNPTTALNTSLRQQTTLTLTYLVDNKPPQP